MLISIFSSITVFVGVYYAYERNSDFAKKYLVVIVAGIFLYSGIDNLVTVMNQINHMEIWENIHQHIYAIVQIVTFCLLLVLLLNNFRRSDRFLLVSLWVYFILECLKIYDLYS